MNPLDELVRSLHTKMPMATQEDAIAFAHRLVAELAKQEPVAWKMHGVPAYQNTKPTNSDKWFPLYAAPAIPAGWVMVPEEPTVAMFRAAEQAGMHSYTGTWTIDPFACYKSMLSAAPKGEGK